MQPSVCSRPESIINLLAAIFDSLIPEFRLRDHAEQRRFWPWRVILEQASETALWL
jgi:hypothetical protein